MILKSRNFREGRPSKVVACINSYLFELWLYGIHVLCARLGHSLYRYICLSHASKADLIVVSTSFAAVFLLLGE